MLLFQNFFLAIVGIALLIWGAEKFVFYSSNLAKRFGVSDLLIGLTLIAFGTSAPEIFIGISSIFNDAGEIPIGISPASLNMLEIPMNISGADVPNAINVRPISKSLTPNLFAKLDE